MTGDTVIHSLRNNWKFWGAKGAMTMHGGFELGVASVIAYRKFNSGAPDDSDVRQLEEKGYIETYKSHIKQVAQMQMYETFAKKGWNTKLAKQTNQELIPLIIRSVTLAWLSAAKSIDPGI